MQGPSSEARIRFLVSPFQNAFFQEMATVIVEEIGRLDRSADIINARTAAEPNDVYVLLPTHEYLVLEGHEHLSDDVIASRTIGITAEQPTSSHFGVNVDAGRKLGAIFDFSSHSVAAYRRHGLRCHHLPFGWTPSWDHYRTAPNIGGPDILFLGASTPRRRAALAQLARPLWQRSSKLVISDNSRRPNHEGSSSFVTGEEKRRLLASSSVLLNIHQTDEPYFEWLRVTEAAMCGTVVVTEPSIHMDPYVNGVHLAVHSVPGIAGALDDLLDDPAAIARLRRDAYELVRARPFSRAIERLVEVADGVNRKCAYASGTIGPTRSTPYGHVPTARSDRDRDQADVVRQAIREIRLDLMEVRRQLQAVRISEASATADPQVVHQSPATELATNPPKVSVLMAVYNHGSFVPAALSSAANAGCDDLELIVVDDGSADDSLDVARCWITDNPDVRARLVAVPVNRGLPHARNTAIEFATGEYCFVLDADNEVLPGGLDRLVAALDDDPSAAFAFGVLETFSNSGPVGLLGELPWDVGRLPDGNYIDAMAMIKRDVLVALGGYATDRRLYGWEDYDLWCRIAESGRYGVHVPTLVARYRLAMSSMVSLSNLSHDAAFDALHERAPRLMSRTLTDRPGPAPARRSSEAIG